LPVVFRFPFSFLERAGHTVHSRGGWQRANSHRKDETKSWIVLANHFHQGARKMQDILRIFMDSLANL
jgi:hypothetical protein